MSNGPRSDDLLLFFGDRMRFTGSTMRRPPFESALAASLILIAATIPVLARANPVIVGPGHAHLLGLPLALGVEIPIVAALFPGRRLRLALTCAAANSGSYVVLFWGLDLVNWGFLPLVAGEVCATIVEAAAYAIASRRPGRSLVASALANLASFAVGLAVFGGPGALTVLR